MFLYFYVIQLLFTTQSNVFVFVITVMVLMFKMLWHSMSSTLSSIVRRSDSLASINTPADPLGRLSRCTSPSKTSSLLNREHVNKSNSCTHSFSQLTPTFNKAKTPNITIMLNILKLNIWSHMWEILCNCNLKYIIHVYEIKSLLPCVDIAVGIVDVDGGLDDSISWG